MMIAKLTVAAGALAHSSEGDTGALLLPEYLSGMMPPSAKAVLVSVIGGAAGWAIAAENDRTVTHTIELRKFRIVFSYLIKGC
jgi:hypothetical protein